MKTEFINDLNDKIQLLDKRILNYSDRFVLKYINKFQRLKYENISF